MTSFLRIITLLPLGAIVDCCFAQSLNISRAYTELRELYDWPQKEQLKSHELHFNQSFFLNALQGI